MPPSVFIALAERLGLIAQSASWHAQGLQPARLTSEITEPAMKENSVDERGTLGRIAALGVRLSIDDFGTKQFVQSLGDEGLGGLRIPLRPFSAQRGLQ